MLLFQSLLKCLIFLGRFDRSLAKLGLSLKPNLSLFKSLISYIDQFLFNALLNHGSFYREWQLQTEEAYLIICIFFLNSFSLSSLNLVTWKPGVNFINILHARFSYESKLSSFCLITFGFVIFCTKILYKKRTRKMLMKLTASHQSFCAFGICSSCSQGDEIEPR